MFSFKYMPNKYAPMRKVSVPNGFYRVGCTKSYFSVASNYNDYGYNTDIVFWSYETPIAYVVVDKARIDHQTRETETSFVFYVNKDALNISQTTKRQFARFVRLIAKTYDVSAALDYQLIKDALSLDKHVVHEIVDNYNPTDYPTSSVWVMSVTKEKMLKELEYMQAPKPVGGWV